MSQRRTLLSRPHDNMLSRPHDNMVHVELCDAALRGLERYALPVFDAPGGDHAIITAADDTFCLFGSEVLGPWNNYTANIIARRIEATKQCFAYRHMSGRHRRTKSTDNASANPPQRACKHCRCEFPRCHHSRGTCLGWLQSPNATGAAEILIRARMPQERKGIYMAK